MKGVHLILLPKQSCIPAFVAGRREPFADVVLSTFVSRPSLLYVVVGAYPINISSDIIFHVRIHPT